MSELQDTKTNNSTTTQNEAKKKTLRCAHEGCRRKLGLVPFTCRCTKDFCAEHRGGDAHACTYDYKAEHKKELLKYMSTAVVGQKVIVI
jgi:predicted nucleic acid binding AN1-type Zn finger protein